MWIRQWLKSHLSWGVLIFALAYLLIGWFWSWKLTIVLVVGTIVVIALDMGYDYAQQRIRDRVAMRHQERR